MTDINGIRIELASCKQLAAELDARLQDYAQALQQAQAVIRAQNQTIMVQANTIQAFQALEYTRKGCE